MNATTPQDMALRRFMQTAWVTFARIPTQGHRCQHLVSAKTWVFVACMVQQG